MEWIPIDHGAFPWSLLGEHNELMSTVCTGSTRWRPLLFGVWNVFCPWRHWRNTLYDRIFVRWNRILNQSPELPPRSLISEPGMDNSCGLPGNFLIAHSVGCDSVLVRFVTQTTSKQPTYIK